MNSEQCTDWADTHTRQLVPTRFTRRAALVKRRVGESKSVAKKP